MKKILGISAFYHDSAAALLIDGIIIAAVQEERFTREKHTPDFPVQAIQYCLEEGGLSIDELDAIVFYDKPLLKFERLLETYYAFAPKGLWSFLKAMPVWLREKMFLKKQIYEGLKSVGPYDRKQLKLLFSEHHLSHAGSAFFTSTYRAAAILTIDGVGEWCTTAIAHGQDNSIQIQREMHFPHSVGLLYSAFTYYLGFKVNSGEYKLMGLAAYGNPEAVQTKQFIKIICTQLIDIKTDGSIWMNPSYFNYATGLTMVKENKWSKLFDLPIRKAERALEQQHCNLALAIQTVIDDIVLKMGKEAKRLTGSDNLCLAGGVALNCVANGKLVKSGIFKNIYIQPAAGDAGGALGAALVIHHMYYGEKRAVDQQEIVQFNPYLGPAYSEKEIVLMNRKHKAVYEQFVDFGKLTNFVAQKISEGQVIGWFQGRMEFGPRALGNRSILGDPRNPTMQKKINLKIKYREGFRPFAPSVMKEEANNFFDLKGDSPYMLLVALVKEELRNALPDDFFDWPLLERLYFERSSIPAITHLDFSARIQTVDVNQNPKYWQLLAAFKEQTGYGMLINTSFNVRGEPIVCSPEDAYFCFRNTEMDYLVINDFVYCKKDQVDWEKQGKWKKSFKLD